MGEATDRNRRKLLVSRGVACAAALAVLLLFGAPSRVLAGIQVILMVSGGVLVLLLVLGVVVIRRRTKARWGGR